MYAEMITRVNKLEDEINKYNLNISKVKWYELLASIAYWYKRGNKDESLIIKIIKDTKPQFSEKEIKSAYNAYLDFKFYV
ncbi:hypothetical protein [Desulfofalx alkaliphila]|uniref:hypothetical protein n=1 Tax=Desulfofalx alkaliphila TaxID=105483 RepID=UPI0004E1BAA7|nr:hypothetical protein [Desulfofalx alkaliphila]